jgi:hypothetical protein
MVWPNLLESPGASTNTAPGVLTGGNVISETYLTFQRSIKTGGYLETYDKSIGAFGSDCVC